MPEPSPENIINLFQPAADDDSRDAVKAFLELESGNPGLGWLGLWKASVEFNSKQSVARALSFILAKDSSASPLREAVRLWFLNAWVGTDFSTCINVLTSVEETFDEGQGGIPLTARSSVMPFLLRCANHSEPIVRHSVLDLLENASVSERLQQFAYQSAARLLAGILERELNKTAAEDERRVLKAVCDHLRSDDLLITLDNGLSALQALRDELDAIGKSFIENLGSVEGLTAVVDLVIQREKGIAASTKGSLIPAPNFDRLASLARPTGRYRSQLDRVRGSGQEIDCIDEAVEGVVRNLPKSTGKSLVVYGDPQSGKTEMMICLTARLLDDGHRTIVHLMNDSVDLLVQNLDRFVESGLAPAARNASDLANSPLADGDEAVLFCKKNAKDLPKLIDELKHAGPVVVIDDEADFATPNAKINSNDRTRINDLVFQLLGQDGEYIGVTATPARLNLNNTFNNRPETWVRFRPHSNYTGQDQFFPQKGVVPYRLTQLAGAGDSADAQKALARFLVTVAFLNTRKHATRTREQNYSLLVHTSGNTAAHKADRQLIEEPLRTLRGGGSNTAFQNLVSLVHHQAIALYGIDDVEVLTEYVVSNASRAAVVVLNSERDRKTAGDRPTVPRSPFTIIIGGNIVSRGVTFPNLLAMFFTRNVKSKLQQDTYIQRARMFGARGAYLEHFELTIPRDLYADWHRCFVFHKLALQAIEKDSASPVWIGDKRIAIAASSSIDRGTVDLNRGEMSFQIFRDADISAIDDWIREDPKSLATLHALRARIGDSLPQYLLDYLEAALEQKPGSLAIHTSTRIGANYADVNTELISRAKGLIGNPQLEERRFPGALHHIKIFYNEKGAGRVFYKNLGGVVFVQNMS